MMNSPVLPTAYKSLAADSPEKFSGLIIQKLVQLAPESIRISIVPLRGGPIESTIYSVSVIIAHGRTFIGKGPCKDTATLVATMKAFTFLSSVEGDGVNPIDRQLRELLDQVMKTEKPLKQVPVTPVPFDAKVWAFGEPPCEATDSKKLADDSALQLAKVPTIQLTIDGEVAMELPTPKDLYQIGAIKAFNLSCAPQLSSIDVIHNMKMRFPGLCKVNTDKRANRGGGGNKCFGAEVVTTVEIGHFPYAVVSGNWPKCRDTAYEAAYTAMKKVSGFFMDFQNATKHSISTKLQVIEQLIVDYSDLFVNSRATSPFSVEQACFSLNLSGFHTFQATESKGQYLKVKLLVCETIYDFLANLSVKLEMPNMQMEQPLLQLCPLPITMKVTGRVKFTDQDRLKIEHLNAFNFHFNPKVSPHRNMVTFHEKEPNAFSIGTTFLGNLHLYEAVVSVFGETFRVNDCRRDLAVKQALNEAFKLLSQTSHMLHRLKEILPLGQSPFEMIFDLSQNTECIQMSSGENKDIGSTFEIVNPFGRPFYVFTEDNEEKEAICQEVIHYLQAILDIVQLSLDVERMPL